MLRIHFLEIIGVKKYNFNIDTYNQECKNNDKYRVIVDEFTKKYSNYSISKY